MKKKSQEYDEEPVYYCRYCMSLNVRPIDGMEEVSYCDDCGSDDILTDNIYEYLRKKAYRDSLSEKKKMKF